MNPVDETIQTLFRVFQPYSIGGRVKGCPCCVDPDEELELAQVPLHVMTFDGILSRYFMAAMTTWGTVSDFKHFLPRICSLIYRSGSSDVWLLRDKLAYAGFLEWPDAEKQAVVDFAVHATQQQLMNVSLYTIQQWIELCQLLGIQLCPLFEPLLESPSPQAASVLSHFVLIAGSAAQGQRRMGFGVLYGWLLTDRVAELLLETVVEFEDQNSDQWALAYDTIQCLRGW